MMCIIRVLINITFLLTIGGCTGRDHDDNNYDGLRGLQLDNTPSLYTDMDVQQPRDLDSDQRAAAGRLQATSSAELNGAPRLPRRPHTQTSPPLNHDYLTITG